MKRFLIFLIILLSLTGCAELTYFNPEDAVTKATSRSNQGGDFVIDSQTIKVLQKQELKGHFFMLVTYQGFDQHMNMNMQCLAMSDVFKNRLNTWTVGSGTGSCVPVGQKSPNPIEIGAGQSRGQAPFTFDLSSVTGFVNDPQIKTVAITWADGQSQQVPVAENAYIAVREGLSKISAVSGLDETGQAFFTTTMGAE